MPTAFPPGFRWGTATAGHQIEGGNWNSDWWAFEHDPTSGCVEPSGDACDSWHLWPDDVALCRELGFDNYRFSLEWSRIEPEEGEFSKAALDHYRRQCDAMGEAGLKRVVTFNHFTLPRWVGADGGWLQPATADRFGRFCSIAAAALGDRIDRACTINEPNIVATHGYLSGRFPPGHRDAEERRTANRTLVEGHRRGVEAIRDAAPGVAVGITLAMSDYWAVDGGETKRDEVRRRMEDEFLDGTDGDDFIGVQTYSRARIGPEGDAGPEPGVPTLVMGYEYWPDALEATLRRAWDYTKGRTALLVTENGIGTDDDEQRIAYVRTALTGVLRCLADGIDVVGYTYWSLLDNFEWALGYGPRFGLVSVDRHTFERSPKPSARWLGEIAKANALPD
jgi:beta-glucosidase